MSSFWRVFGPLILSSFLLLTTGTWNHAAAAVQLNLAWADSSDNENGFKIERKTDAVGFQEITTVGANVSTYTDASILAGTTYYYRVRAYNSAGNSAYSNEASGMANNPPLSPTFTLTVTKAGAGSGTVSGPGIACGTDCAQTYDENTPVILAATADATSTFVSWSGDCGGQGTVSMTADKTCLASFELRPPPPPPNPTDLVAAYSFDENGGGNVADASGNNNVGTISGATWTTQGKFGAALSFDGSNDWVTIQDAASLDLTTGMTLEAWVYPTVQATDWATVILKEQDYDLVYALYAERPTDRPGAILFTSSKFYADGTSVLPLNTWSHLTATYNGTMFQLYVNGGQVATRAVTGNLVNSAAPVRIGGNSVWGEFFQGQIDEVRIYNRALTASEVQVNMTIPVGTLPPPPPPPPTYSLTVTKSGAGSGTVSGPGIACGTDCAGTYDENTQVTLVATTDGTSMFVGWSGDCGGQGTVSMTADKTCMASFKLLPPPPPPNPTASNVRIGIFRPSTGEWFLDVNGDGEFGSCIEDGGEDGCVVSFGEPDEVPVVGDWDGSGMTRLGVFNPNTLLWKLDQNADDVWEGGVDLLVGPFGQAGDRVVVGDWTGSGTTTIGVKRNRGKWWLDVNGNGQWDGCNGDSCPNMGGSNLPVVGDWTGSGTDKVGFFRFNREGQGIWQLDGDGNGIWNNTLDLQRKPFGQLGDLPIVGDWNGDGTTQIGVFDPATGLWELDFDGNGKWDGCEIDVCLGPFGQQGDLPVVGKW